MVAFAPLLFALGALLAPGAAFAQACEGGLVYLDRDGDGRRDRGERGLPGVRVSDGVAIADTDARGRYQLAPAPGRRLFLVKPAGYAAALRPDGLPDSWREPGACGDFALRPAARAKPPLDLLVFGDPQLKLPVHADHYEADIVAPLRSLAGGPGATLALTLGDIVDDQLHLYPAIKRIDASLGIPWLHVPGNHDVDPGEHEDAGTLDGFQAAFGPDTYAWEEPQANFLVLDDVIMRPAGGKPYVGGLRAGQFAFLEAYLAKADPRRLLVLALHIPLFDVDGVETFRAADRRRLFDLLARFPHVLVLSAHTHGQQHYFHGAEAGWSGAVPLHEYNVGASCGGYWGGARDAQGIPSATMADGTPNGYARLRIGADAVPSMRWFAAREPAEAQMHLHAPRVLRRGAYPGVGVYANVWMGRPDTRVEYRIDQGDWRAMKRVLQPDPAVLAENLRDDAASALRAFNRTPEAAVSPHLWKANLPTDLSAGRHRIEVRAQVEDFGVATETAYYELVEAAP